MIFVHSCGEYYEFDLSESCLSHFFLVIIRIRMIIKKKPFNTMAVCATLGRLGQKKLCIIKQPQIATIKSDASKMIRKVLGFIIVRKGLVFAN